MYSSVTYEDLPVPSLPGQVPLLLVRVERELQPVLVHLLHHLVESLLRL